MLELHSHTTCSDGTLTPSELVQAAVRAGVRALAITDHDTLSGWDEAISEAQRFANASTKPYSLEIVPGVELSTVTAIALSISWAFTQMLRSSVPPLSERLEGRKRRARQMVANLAALGYPVSLPELGEGIAPSRPHLAKALVERVMSSRCVKRLTVCG
jgi:predicted metal-dependent phosphoesterase TrpH